MSPTPTTNHGMTILAPEGMLGYGIPVRSLAEGMKRNPHAIAVDAGSTDPGRTIWERACPSPTGARSSATSP